MAKFTDRASVIEYLLNEGPNDFTAEELEPVNDWELLETLLHWEGIVGFTDMILSACEALGLPETEDKKRIAKLEGEVHYLVELLDERQLEQFTNWSISKELEGVNLKGKLVLEVWSGGRWVPTDYAENTNEGRAALESRYDDFDTPYVRIQYYT